MLKKSPKSAALFSGLYASTSSQVLKCCLYYVKFVYLCIRIQDWWVFGVIWPWALDKLMAYVCMCVIERWSKCSGGTCGLKITISVLKYKKLSVWTYVLKKCRWNKWKEIMIGWEKKQVVNLNDVFGLERNYYIFE